MVRASSRSAVLALIAAFAVTLLPGAAAQPAAAVSPNIVISQVYGAGGNSGAVLTHDYVELYNRGASPASLNGWSIQYASATGSGNLGSTATQITELPNVSLDPGQYYLVQEAGGANGSPLPPPNLIDPTPIAMAAAAGKVALVNEAASLGCNGSSTPCDAAQLAKIVDLVGYGLAATFYETAPTANISTTTAALRNGGGATDTDNNSEDFTVGTPDPRTSAADPAPTVASTNPANGAVGVALDAAISITFSEPVAIALDTVTMSCDGSPVVVSIDSGPATTFEVVYVPPLPEGVVCTVDIDAAGVTDADANDPPDAMADDYSFSFTTFTEDVCSTAATKIHAIQGSGATSPLVGQVHTVEAVVVGDFQPSTATSFNGFHLQEEDGDADADPATSEGIFIFEGSNAVEVAEGDLVRVTGTVAEFLSSGQRLTQLTSVSGVVVCDSGVSVTPTVLDMPFDSTTFPERFEGMLVAFDPADTVVATEVFNFGRFGEIVLSTGDRLWIPTHLVEPGAPAQELQADNDRNRIVLDDGRNDQNIDPTLFPAGGLSATNTLRVGDTMTGGTFVLEQRFGLYRLQPTSDLPAFVATNPRPATAPDVGGDLQVASFNVLNYFDTLDLGPDICGPLEDQECRGADSEAELERQRDKIVAAMFGLDADVLGLIEIENDGGDAVVDLVEALNDAGAGPYDYIDTGTIGSDAIKLALIYQPASVSPVGDFAILDSTVDPRFDDTRSRPALAQTFDSADGGRFTVVVNHLKSKGSACPEDPDEGDGQGNCSDVRRLAAEALVDWLASDPTGSGDRDVLVIGDLNSYAKEDPIDVFVDAGYTDLLEAFGGDSAYSYVFQGQTGYLDHALASPTLAAQVAGAAAWHINADEPPVLDYNTEFKSPGHVGSLYAPTPFRSSDHDPVLVGLDLLDYGFDGFRPPVANPPAVNELNSGSTVPFKFTLSGSTSLDVLFGDPVSWQVDCSTGDDLGAPAAATSTFGLMYDPIEAVYTYEWKTLKSFARTCRTFELTLDDGTYRTADFHFRK